jgi:hypothetical protein
MAGGCIFAGVRSADISVAATARQANMDQNTLPQLIIQLQPASSPESLGSGIIKQERKSKELSCFLLTLTPHPNLPQVRGGRCRTIGNQSLNRLHTIRKLKVKEKGCRYVAPGRQDSTFLSR